MQQEIGKIIEFNGYGGTIESNKEEFLLLDNNIIEDKNNLKINDIVEFIPETMNNIKIARFVKKRYPKTN